MATPTLQQLRAELDARTVMAKLIMDAMRRGDPEACERAQTAMRETLAANSRRAA